MKWKLPAKKLGSLEYKKKPKVKSSDSRQSVSYFLLTLDLWCSKGKHLPRSPHPDSLRVGGCNNGEHGTCVQRSKCSEVKRLQNKYLFWVTDGYFKHTNESFLSILDHYQMRCIFSAYEVSGSDHFCTRPKLRHVLYSNTPYHCALKCDWIIAKLWRRLGN